MTIESAPGQGCFSDQARRRVVVKRKSLRVMVWQVDSKQGMEETLAAKRPERAGRGFGVQRRQWAGKKTIFCTSVHQDNEHWTFKRILSNDMIWYFTLSQWFVQCTCGGYCKVAQFEILWLLFLKAIHLVRSLIWDWKEYPGTAWMMEGWSMHDKEMMSWGNMVENIH